MVMYRLNPYLPRSVPSGYRYRRRASLTGEAWIDVQQAIHLAPDGDIHVRDEHNRPPWLGEWDWKPEVSLTFHSRTRKAATYVAFLVGGEDLTPVRRRRKPAQQPPESAAKPFTGPPSPACGETASSQGPARSRAGSPPPEPL